MFLPYTIMEMFLAVSSIVFAISDVRADIKTIPNGIRGTAKTTRYWDCCKPSCSWAENVQGASPVGSCSGDGNTRVGAHEQSGCNGGPAFVCNDQQPWAVNNNLAYGFVAGSFSGGTDNSKCCVCLRLRFHHPQNKEMIVQVTNTGGDLGQNHFDIQIPGGGVGYFNQGCQKQWQAPWTGWGQQYGGVGSEGECDQLPWQLREGCKFRFRFLEGADNPNVDFEQVECPGEIVARTNCRK